MEVKIQTELLTALQYIHSKGLVHMELRCTTLTLTEDGDVKITGACMPRRADFPEAADTQFEAADFVYLAPEVIDGRNLYIAPADMYSFALLVLELRTRNFTVFGDKRRMPLAIFKTLIPRQILKEAIYSTPYSENYQELLSLCLDVNIDKRPDAAKVYDALQQTNRIKFRKTVPVAGIFRKVSAKR